MCLVLYRGTYQSSLSTVRHQESVLCLFFSFKRYQSLAEQTRQSVRPRRLSYAEIWGQAPTTLLNVPGINRHLLISGTCIRVLGVGPGKIYKIQTESEFPLLVDSKKIISKCILNKLITIQMIIIRVYFFYLNHCNFDPGMQNKIVGICFILSFFYVFEERFYHK